MAIASLAGCAGRALVAPDDRPLLCHPEACAAAGLAHPTADAQFERLLHDAEPSALRRSLAATLDAQAGCTSATGVARVRIEVARLEAGMGCLLGHQTYWLSVQWRAVASDSGRLLAERVMRCEVESHRLVDDWLAHPDAARTELEGAMARAGERIALDMVEGARSATYKLRADAQGRVEFR